MSDNLGTMNSWGSYASPLIAFISKYPVISYSKNLTEYLPYRPFPSFNLNMGIYGIMPFLSTTLYRQTVFTTINYYGLSLGWSMDLTENLELGVRVTNFICFLPYVTYKNFLKGILDYAGCYLDKNKVCAWPMMTIDLSSFSLQNIYLGVDVAGRYVGLDLATTLSTINKYRKFII